MPDFLDIRPVNLPGRGGRLHEPLFRDMERLVEAAGEALLPHFNTPFAFFGHSMGALVSLELARLCRRRGWAMPVHLFVSGHAAPQVPDKDPPTWELPEAEFIEELRRLNGTPADALEHPELMELLIPVLRADFQVCQTYSYSVEPPLGCGITAFGGLQDTDTPREEVDAWREHTTGRFTLRMLPGDHFFLHSHEHILLEAMARELHGIVNQLSSVARS